MSAVGQTGEVPGFADRLGERLVVAQPSGALLEFLLLQPQLASASFFEGAVKSRLKRLSNFRHAAYARVTRLQREGSHGNRLALVSAYTPGRRLADVMVLARRGKIQPRITAVLSLAKQLMTGVALLHDYAPDVFHGAIGPERVVVAPDGRLVITEYVLGTAIEQAVAEWGSARLWREYRLATLSDTSLSRFGRRLDLVQIGLFTLSLLLGRQPGDGDFPNRLSDLLHAARETTGEGEALPLGTALREWLAKLLCLEPSSAFRTLVEAQKAFGRMVEEEPRYGVTSHAVEAFFQQCEEAGLTSVLPANLGPSPEALPKPASPPPKPDVVTVVAPPPPESVPVADLLATLPPSAPANSSPMADPFGPWPVVVGTDTVATLFDTFNAPVAVRESPAVAIPGSGQGTIAASPGRDETAPRGPGETVPAEGEETAPARMEPRRQAAVPSVQEAVLPRALAAAPEDAALTTPRLEELVLTDAWTPDPGLAPVPEASWASPSHVAAGEFRETLFEVPPEEPASLSPVDAARPEAPKPAPVVRGEDIQLVPSREWSAPIAPRQPEGKVEVLVLEPAHTPAAQPERPKTTDAPPAERRAATVLSYEKVHEASPNRRSKAPLIWVAAIIVVASVGVLGWPRVAPLLRSWSARTEAPNAAADPTKAPGEPGGFRITTQPPGGKITIDGVPRGSAPVRVTDLAPGVHSISVESEWGTVEEAVTVEAGKVVPLALATVGWIKVASPVELHVSEEGRSFGTTSGTLMVPAGRHHFVFVNQDVAVRLRHFVEVPPGQTVTVPLDLPRGMLNLTSDQPAQVLLDGEVIGDTPLVAVPAALGRHEVVFRSPKYGDVNYTVNVTLAAPVRLTCSFSKR